MDPRAESKRIIFHIKLLFLLLTPYIRVPFIPTLQALISPIIKSVINSVIFRVVKQL